MSCDLWGKHPTLDFYFGWLLGILAVIIGIGCVSAITAKIVMLYRSKSSMNEGNSNLWTVVWLCSAALKYMFAYGFYLLSLMIVSIVMGVGDGNKTDKELDHAWALCVFKYFDGVSDASFQTECGCTPEHKLSFGTLSFLQFYTYGMHGLLFIGVYWTPLKDLYIKNFWPSRYHARVEAYNNGDELPPSSSSSMPEQLSPSRPSHTTYSISANLSAGDNHRFAPHLEVIQSANIDMSVPESPPDCCRAFSPCAEELVERDKYSRFPVGYVNPIEDSDSEVGAQPLPSETHTNALDTTFAGPELLRAMAEV